LRKHGVVSLSSPKPDGVVSQRGVIRLCAQGSDLRLAAVDEEFDAVDEARILGSEKQHGLGDFLGWPIRPAGIRVAR
jgi:hypothetical protein